MRKKCHRNTREVARRLTPQQNADLLLGPRLHLHMLLVQKYDLTYVCSIAWVFNIAVVLAFEADRRDLLRFFIPVQDIVLILMNEMRGPTTNEGDELRNAFNVADHWFGLQNVQRIAMATKYASQEWFENGLPA